MTCFAAIKVFVITAIVSGALEHQPTDESKINHDLLERSPSLARTVLEMGCDIEAVDTDVTCPSKDPTDQDQWDTAGLHPLCAALDPALLQWLPQQSDVHLEIMADPSLAAVFEGRAEEHG